MTYKQAINYLFCSGFSDEQVKVVVRALNHNPCEDCISREGAKQFLYERIDRLNDDELYDIFSRIIDDMYNELPPVIPQPKTGHWIKIKPYPLQMNDYECSECGHETDDNTENYCSDCGAKMFEPQESEENDE